MIKEISKHEVEILGYDPLVNNIEEEFGIEAVLNFEDANDIDCVILAVAHRIFEEITLDKLEENMNSNPALIDVRGFLVKKKLKERAFAIRVYEFSKDRELL